MHLVVNHWYDFETKHVGVDGDGGDDDDAAAAAAVAAAVDDDADGDEGDY